MEQKEIERIKKLEGKIKEQTLILEAKKKIYADTIVWVASDEINIEFFNEKAATFKKGSPDYTKAIDERKTREANLYWNLMMLRIARKQIAEMKETIAKEEAKQIDEALKVPTEQTHERPNTI